MFLFTSGDISKLTTITNTMIIKWCKTGIVTPIGGGGIQGAHRQWTLMQLVGFLAGDEVRNSEVRCAPAYVGSIVAAFESVTEEWLQAKLAEGERYLVRPHLGQPLLSTGKAYGWADVGKAYERVTKYAAKKYQRMKV